MMAKYRVTAPDGSTYEISAPDGASEADVMAYAQSQFAQQVPSIEKPTAVKAGETIMEIVPAEDRLLITAKIKPADIAFLKPGQDARIRISAYDSSIFGTLPGKVLRVGADAVVDGEKKETFFEVLLEAQRNFLGDPSEHLTISPGMAADASIHTGKRTMMEYMLKPIVKTFDKSLRER